MTIMNLFFVCLLFFVAFFSMMAVGVLFGKKEIKGSCGGMLLDENGDDTNGLCGICGRGVEEIKLQGCDS